MDKARVDLCQRSAATIPIPSARAQFLHAAKALVAADDNQALTQNIVNALRASIMDFEASLAASDPEPLKASALSNVGDGSDALYQTAFDAFQSTAGSFSLQLNAAITAALRSAAMKDAPWLPIGTAAKDGTVCLVNDTTGTTRWCAAKWLDDEQWQGWIYDDELLNDSNPVGPQPTVWLPAAKAH